MYSQYRKNHGCGSKSSPMFFLPILFVFLIFTRLTNLPLWTTLFIIFFLFKFMKYGYFGHHRNSNFSNPSRYSNQLSKDLGYSENQQSYDIAVDFDQNNKTEQPLTEKLENKNQFCIECGIKLPLFTNFCNNCGTLQNKN